MADEPKYTNSKPSLEVKLRVLSAIDYAPGDSIRDRIKQVSTRVFRDEIKNIDYRFTWRTIETWRARFRKHGMVSMDRKTRSDKYAHRKVQPNELWQADTLYGPSIKQSDGRWKKTFLIAFIDDASRVITHAEFFYADNTENMIDAFKSALFKRGKPERLYFDNGANYKSKEILQACVRLNIQLSHAPIRDGAAKGKIERFFRGFRDRFLTQHLAFDSLEILNQHTHEWIEQQYNSQYHSGIQMAPLDRFLLCILMSSEWERPHWLILCSMPSAILGV